MTYKKLYEIAEWKLDHGEITSGEFDEMTKPLDEEIRIWIPCSERLPDKSGAYLTTYVFKHEDKKCLGIRFFNEEYGFVGSSLINVLAWMPVPKTYKKEGDKK